MVEVVVLSDGHEVAAAGHLARSIRRCWPGVGDDPDDRVTLLVGVRAGREIDILALVELREPRAYPGGSIRCAAIAIEVKELDPAQFEIVGNLIFPAYGRARVEPWHGARSVNQQIADTTIALRKFAGSYGIAVPFVYGLGWLRNVPPGELAGVEPNVLGSDASWMSMLDAAARQHRFATGPQGDAQSAGIATLRLVLTRKRALSPLQRQRADAISKDTLDDDVLDDLQRHAGRVQCRIYGRGGTGKTTTLAMLAARLASGDGDRVLVLTFHQALRNDIASLVEALRPEFGTIGRISVQSLFAHLLCVLDGLGLEIPRNAAGALEYGALDHAFGEAAEMMVGESDSGDAQELKKRDPGSFAWDVVMIDEAQDCSDNERALLRAMYGTRRLVLADGLDQLVRRATPCDWNAGVAKADRFDRALDRSLRMTEHLATFANAFASAAGIERWRVKPHRELYGGSIVIATGPNAVSSGVIRSIRRVLDAGGAKPIDALFCTTGPFAERLLAASERVWDGTNPDVRALPPHDSEAWRIVKYDSARGLEGWCVALFDLDGYYEQRLRHPNVALSDGCTARDVALRALMIAMTRAMHTLVVTITDPASPLAGWLGTASGRLPDGVVRWTSSDDLAATIASP